MEYDIQELDISCSPRFQSFEKMGNRLGFVSNSNGFALAHRTKKTVYQDFLPAHCWDYLCYAIAYRKAERCFEVTYTCTFEYNVPFLTHGELCFLVFCEREEMKNTSHHNSLKRIQNGIPTLNLLEEELGIPKTQFHYDPENNCAILRADAPTWASNAFTFQVYKSLLRATKSLGKDDKVLDLRNKFVASLYNRFSVSVCNKILNSIPDCAKQKFSTWSGYLGSSAYNNAAATGPLGWLSSTSDNWHIHSSNQIKDWVRKVILND